MKNLLSSFCSIVVIAVLSGCGTPGFPRQSYNEKKQIQDLEAVFEKPDMIKNFFAMTNATEAEKEAARNQIIAGRIALINLNYNQFIAQFSVTKESLDFGSDVTGLGLNLATTAVGGEETKTILSAISSGVSGTKLAIDKNFFFEKTVPVLVASMNAGRKVALLPIMVGVTNTTEDYPLTQGLSDLDSYYFAGTFVGALQAIQADAGAKQAQAETNLNSVRMTKFTNDASSKLLQSYWTPNVSGTVTITSTSDAVVGTGTHFTNEIAVGDQIAAGTNSPVAVKAIVDDSHLTAAANFTANNNNVAYQVFNSEHQKAIESWQNTNGLSAIPIQTLINGDVFSEARKKAVQDLKIQPQK